LNEVEKTVVKKARFRVVGMAVLVLSDVILAFFCVSIYTELQHQRSLNTDLQNQIIDANNQLSSLVTEYYDYKSIHSHNDSEYDKAFFCFYYVKQVKQRFGNISLHFELGDLNWTEPYQENVFDCGEMSACLERYLENRGWHVKLVFGDSPSGRGVKHVWLLVETSQWQYMPVESTRLELVWPYDLYFENYFTYDYAFETIQDAMMHNESEVDWWKLGFSPLECKSIFDS